MSTQAVSPDQVESTRKIAERLRSEIGGAISLFTQARAADFMGTSASTVNRNRQDGTGAPGRIAVHPWKARFEARYGRQRDLLVWCIEQLQAQGFEVPDGALRAAGMLEYV